jgi:hypothetical protein
MLKRILIKNMMYNIFQFMLRPCIKTHSKSKQIMLKTSLVHTLNFCYFIWLRQAYRLFPSIALSTIQTELPSLALDENQNEKRLLSQ